jgi:hypothetical protein
MNNYLVHTYLTTGNSFISLHYEYLLGVTTICDKICECLNDRPAREVNKWICTANEFYERTDFPNYIGAVDRKNVRITKPNESEFPFCNIRIYSVWSSWLW